MVCGVMQQCHKPYGKKLVIEGRGLKVRGGKGRRGKGQNRYLYVISHKRSVLTSLSPAGGRRLPR